MAITKYTIFSVIFFGYAMFAYNRKGVSFAIPKLLEEGLGSEQLGLILSSQNLAYAISKFLGGIISDRLSSRILFSVGLLVSGLAAVIFSAVDSVVLFTIAWFLNGLAQGLGWPAIAKLLKNWFKPSELGTWWSITSASANVSGCLAPFLASFIIRNYGWRPSLMFVGALTIAAAGVSYTFIKDSPAKEKGSTSSPTKTGSKNKKEEGGKPFAKLLTAKFIWVISACYLVASLIKTSITDWSQMYLMQDCHQSSLVASSFVSSLEFGGFFGGIAAGYLSDLCMGEKGVLPARGHPRMKVALGFALVTGVCLHSLHQFVNQDTPAIVINQIGMLIGASVYAQIAIFGVVATQSVASEMSGSAHAIAALAANIGSILAGLPLATLAKSTSWTHVMYVLSCIAWATFGAMLMTTKVSYKMDDGVGEKKKSK